MSEDKQTTKNIEDWTGHADEERVKKGCVFWFYLAFISFVATVTMLLSGCNSALAYNQSTMEWVHKASVVHK
jgi:hypothetical protein